MIKLLISILLATYITVGLIRLAEADEVQLPSWNVRANQIVDICETKSTQQEAFCHGFIGGVIETYIGRQMIDQMTGAYPNRFYVCPNFVGLTDEDLRTLIIDHIKTVYEGRLDRTAAEMAIYDAVKSLWPCT